MLRHPRNQFGAPLEHLSGEGAQAARGLLLDSVPLTRLWPQWASMDDEPWRWMRARVLDGLAPASVLAIADRTRAGEPLIVLPDSSGGSAGGSGASSDRTDGGSGDGGGKGDGSGGGKGGGSGGGKGGGRGDGSSDGSGDGTGIVPLIFPCGYAGAEEAWLPQVLLGRCRLRVICLTHLAEQARQTAAAPR